MLYPRILSVSNTLSGQVLLLHQGLDPLALDHIELTSVDNRSGDAITNGFDFIGTGSRLVFELVDRNKHL